MLPSAGPCRRLAYNRIRLQGFNVGYDIFYKNLDIGRPTCTNLYRLLARIISSSEQRICTSTARSTGMSRSSRPIWPPTLASIPGLVSRTDHLSRNAYRKQLSVSGVTMSVLGTHLVREVFHATAGTRRAALCRGDVLPKDGSADVAPGLGP
jgi:tubulin alpha